MHDNSSTAPRREATTSPVQPPATPALSLLGFRLLLTRQLCTGALSHFALQHLTTSTSTNDCVLFWLAGLLPQPPPHCPISKPTAFQQRGSRVPVVLCPMAPALPPAQRGRGDAGPQFASWKVSPGFKKLPPQSWKGAVARQVDGQGETGKPQGQQNKLPDTLPRRSKLTLLRAFDI